MPAFESVAEFEKAMALWYGSQHAVATDSCTHAIELCLRYQGVSQATCPAHTYLSIPMTLEKLNIAWYFVDEPWSDSYTLGHTNIVDAAVLWRESSHETGTFSCLSFQYRKHLNLGRGGMILCDSNEDAKQLKRLSYDGRDPDRPWAEQNITTLGYHYYMTPETAQLGLEKLTAAKSTEARLWTWQDYPDLRNMQVFNGRR